MKTYPIDYDYKGHIITYDWYDMVCETYAIVVFNYTLIL